MTITELERLAKVETRLGGVESGLRRIEGKLDDAIACKADKTELASVAEAVAEKASAADFAEMRKLLINVLIGIAAFTTVTLIAIVLMRLGLQ